MSTIPNLFSFPNLHHSKITIWYKTKETRALLRLEDNLLSGYQNETISTTLKDTHRAVCEVYLPNDVSDFSLCCSVMSLMQGENWSPNGEAKVLIQSLSLTHTSICDNDIIQIDDKFYIIFESNFLSYPLK